MNKIPLLALLAACAAPPPMTARNVALVAAPPATTTCDVPLAIPGDGLDDRAAIQVALDTQGCADLGPGQYDILTPSPRHGLYMLNVTDGRRLRGKGPATTLAFAGDAALGDWYGIQMIGVAPAVSDLMIDTTGVINSSEQTHAIQVTGPASAVQIEGVYFNHAPRGPSGGDCIKTVGYVSNSTTIQGLMMHGLEFLACTRSGFGPHGGTYGVRLTDSNFFGVHKVDIASEDGVDKADFTITGNVFFSSGGSGASAVDMEQTNDVTFTGNTLIGKGALFFDVNGLTYSGNIDIRSNVSDGSAVLFLWKGVTNALVTANTLIRPAGVTPGNVIEVEHDNGVSPSHNVIAGNLIYQGTQFTPIKSYSGGDLTIANNDITTVVADGTTMGIDVGGAIAKADGVLVLGNRIRATSILAAVRISGSALGAGRFSAIGNMATGATQGLRCENVIVAGGGITGPVVSSGNNWPANACSVATPGI